MGEFTVGGPVPLGSEAYVDRAFQTSCVSTVGSGRWFLLLGPRQHGKTSGLARICRDLKEQGFGVALVDGQGYAGPTDIYESFLKWFSTQLCRGLGIVLSQPSPENVHDLEAWLDACLEDTTSSLVIILDEAAAVPPDLRVRFFSQLRAIYNSRVSVDFPDWRQRLSMGFAGTFRPESLIEGENSPFNICEVLYTEDLARDDVLQIATRTNGTDLGAFAGQIYEQVGGQPYLVQRILDTMSVGVDAADQQRLLEVALDRLLHGFDRHLPALFQRVIGEGGGAHLVSLVAGSVDGIPYAAAPPYDVMSVLGVARAEGGRLMIRNELYRKAVLSNPQFNPEFQAAPTTFAPLNSVPADYFSFLSDATLTTLVSESYRSGVIASNSYCFRIALVAFGSCYEGLLLDFLENVLTAAERTTAKGSVNPPLTGIGNNPSSWTFAQMIQIAHASEMIPAVGEGLSGMVREWRNLVHPDYASKNFQPQNDLAPEVMVVVAAIEKLVQALS